MAYTDKVINGYLPMYLQLASDIGIEGRVCELGVDQGGSLELWLTLFPQGLVIGIDSNPNVTVPPGAECLIMDQADEDLPEVLADLGPFDLIVDDASHKPEPTRASFRMLWPLVTPGGYYVIEDWGVAFLGHAPMFEPEMLDVAQDFVILFSDLENPPASLTYMPGMIILEKQS